METDEYLDMLEKQVRSGRKTLQDVPVEHRNTIRARFGLRPKREDGPAEGQSDRQGGRGRPGRQDQGRSRERSCDKHHWGLGQDVDANAPALQADRKFWGGMAEPGRHR